MSVWPMRKPTRAASRLHVVSRLRVSTSSSSSSSRRPSRAAQDAEFEKRDFAIDNQITKRAFERFDSDGDGRISKGDLRRVLQRVTFCQGRKQLSAREIALLMEQMRDRVLDSVSYDDFEILGTVPYPNEFDNAFRVRLSLVTRAKEVLDHLVQFMAQRGGDALAPIDGNDPEEQFHFGQHRALVVELVPMMCPRQRRQALPTVLHLRESVRRWRFAPLGAFVRYDRMGSIDFIPGRDFRRTYCCHSFMTGGSATAAFLQEGRRRQSWKDSHDTKLQLLAQSRRTSIKLGERSPVFESATTAAFAGLHGLKSQAVANQSAPDSVTFGAGESSGTYTTSAIMSSDYAGERSRTTSQPALPQPPSHMVTPLAGAAQPGHIVFGHEASAWTTEQTQRFCPQPLGSAHVSMHKPVVSRLVLGHYPPDWTSTSARNFAAPKCTGPSARARPVEVPRLTSTQAQPGCTPRSWQTNNTLSQIMPSRTVARKAATHRPHHDNVRMAQDEGVNRRDFTTTSAAFFTDRSGMSERTTIRRVVPQRNIVFGNDACMYRTTTREGVFPSIGGRFLRATAPSNRSTNLLASSGPSTGAKPTDYETTFRHDFQPVKLPALNLPKRPAAKVSVLAPTSSSGPGGSEWISTSARTYGDKCAQAPGETSNVRRVAEATKARFSKASWPIQASCADLDDKLRFTTENMRQFKTLPPRRRDASRAANRRQSAIRLTMGDAGATDYTSACRNASAMCVGPVAAPGPRTPHRAVQAPRSLIALAGEPVGHTTSNIMSSAYADA